MTPELQTRPGEPLDPDTDAEIRASVAAALPRQGGEDSVLRGIAQAMFASLDSGYAETVQASSLIDLLGSYQLGLRRGRVPGRFAVAAFPCAYDTDVATVLAMLAVLADAHFGTGLGDLTEQQVWRIAQHLGALAGVKEQTVFPARFGEVRVGDVLFLDHNDGGHRVTAITPTATDEGDRLLIDTRVRVNEDGSPDNGERTHQVCVDPIDPVPPRGHIRRPLADQNTDHDSDSGEQNEDRA